MLSLVFSVYRIHVDSLATRFMLSLTWLLVSFRFSSKIAINSFSIISRIEISSFNLLCVPKIKLKGAVPILRCCVAFRYCCTVPKYLCHSSGRESANFVSTGINVRLTLSTCLFALGIPVVMKTCCIPSVSQYSRKSLEVKAEPRSDTILLGFPKTCACFVKHVKTSAVPVVLTAYSHTNLVKTFTTINMCWYYLRFEGRGPK